MFSSLKPIQNPNLPDTPVKCLIVSKLFPGNMIEVLEKEDIIVKRIPPSKALHSEVAYHPDILCCNTGSGVWVGDLYLSEFFDRLQMETGIPSEYISGQSLSDGYPEEAAYNCFFTKEHLICSKHTAKAVKDFADKLEKEIVTVKQGYTKCSVAICSDDSFITSDRGIHRVLENLGYNVLLIDGSDIALNGYSCGFIGGCCGLIDKNVLAFTGELSLMKDGDNIRSFLANIGVVPLSLAKQKLYDYGGILPFATK